MAKVLKDIICGPVTPATQFPSSVGPVAVVEGQRYVLIPCKDANDAKEKQKELRNITGASLSSEEIVSQIKAAFPDFSQLFEGSKLNLSEIPQDKLEIGKFFVPETLLILASCFAVEKNIHVKEIDMSKNPDIRAVFFLYLLQKVFPEVKKINLSDISANLDKIPDSIVNKYEIVTSEGVLVQKEEKNSNASSSDSDEEDEKDSGYPPDLIHRETSLKLSMFVPIVFKVNEFPTHRFIAEFFDVSWSNITKVGKFYSGGASFSISVDHVRDSAISLYEQFTTNFITSQSCSVIGASDAKALQVHVFPRGFFAHPTKIHCNALGKNFFAVVIHGAFLGVKNIVFGFDRSFVIGDTGLGYLILSDHLYIRNAKL